MPIGIGDATPGAVQFILTIDGFAPIPVSACQNLGTKTEVVEQAVTTTDGRVAYYRKVPGAQRSLNVVLTRPMDTNMDLTKWRQILTSDGVKAKRAGNIVVIDAQGAQIARWDFLGGWPSKLVSSILNNTEELTLTVDTLRRIRM